MAILYIINTHKRFLDNPYLQFTFAKIHITNI